jgi:hypothetical protein
MQLLVKKFLRKKLHLALFIHDVFFSIARKEEEERELSSGAHGVCGPMPSRDSCQRGKA